MRAALVAVLAFVAAAGTASAQQQQKPAWYAGGTVGASWVNYELAKGSTPAAGGVFGFRTSPKFSVEAEITQGARTLTRNIAGQFRYEYAPGTTVSVLGVWKSTVPGRVGLAGYSGLTVGSYRSGFVGSDERGAAHKQSVGLTGGLMFPIAIAGSLSIAPDVRFSFESADSEPAFSARGGIRVLWGF